jgi:hypothetical protein
MTLVKFDRRATHCIFSVPVALDMVNDVDALAQETIRHLEAVHWIALGKADSHLVKGIAVAFARIARIRELTHISAGLIEESLTVDPYLAAEHAATEAA